MASKVNKVAQSDNNDSSNLRSNSLSLSQKLERFDVHLHGGELMAAPLTGIEIFNAE